MYKRISSDGFFSLFINDSYNKSFIIRCQSFYLFYLNLSYTQYQEVLGKEGLTKVLDFFWDGSKHTRPDRSRKGIGPQQ